MSCQFAQISRSIIMARSFALIAVLLIATAQLAACTNSAGLKYLEENKSKPGVITLPSGLQYKVLKSGSGVAHPTADSPCDCHYEGKLIDGSVFDSSYQRGQPTTFAPNQVIKGWTEAMQLMVEGDKWEMYIPSELGYGESGSPPKIQGGDVLVFQMEIIKIKGATKPAVKCNPISLDGCSEQEKEFVGKVSAWTADKQTAEVQRLTKMSAGHMKPELQQWLSRRLVILNKLIAAKDEL